MVLSPNISAFPQLTKAEIFGESMYHFFESTKDCANTVLKKNELSDKFEIGKKL